MDNNNNDDILGDEWDEDFLNRAIEAETVAVSSTFKPHPTNPSSSSTSFSNHHQFQQQQPPKPFVSGGFSPPRELSQRPPPTLFDSDDKDIEFEPFKEHREPRHASKQIVNLEKECLKLKKDRGKKEDQPKFVSSENEEDNSRAKRSKSVENGRDFGIRAPDHPKASSKFQSGVSSNYPTGETTAKDKGVETEIVTHRVAQDLPNDDISAYLDLSQNLLAVWGSPSNKMLRSDVISKLFASCQKEIHYLFGYMSTNSPSEITPKPILDVSSSRVPLHYLNDCFHTPKVHTPEATKVSHLYNALTKIAHETDVLETLIPPLLDLCSMENVAFVHSSLCILHTVLKLLLESEKDFKRSALCSGTVSSLMEFALGRTFWILTGWTV